MAQINITLDNDLYLKIKKQAKSVGKTINEYLIWLAGKKEIKIKEG